MYPDEYQKALDHFILKNLSKDYVEWVHFNLVIGNMCTNESLAFSRATN